MDYRLFLVAAWVDLVKDSMKQMEISIKMLLRVTKANTCGQFSHKSTDHQLFSKLFYGSDNFLRKDFRVLTFIFIYLFAQ